jgi:hypothetical protein
MKKTIIPFHILYNKYIINNKSTHDIAKELGSSAMTILSRLKEYNIKVRDTAVWKGKKRPEHSKKMLGRKNPGVSIANKNRKGINALSYKDGRTLVKHYCKCGKDISYGSWFKGKGQCKSCSNRKNMLGKKPWNKGLTSNIDLRILSGKNNGMFGKTMKPQFVQYNKIWFRSNWEVVYAKYLDSKGIKWLYESKTFDLGNTTYTPDFYLPNVDLYVEVKGYKSDVFIKKFNLFKKIYKDINILILDETYFIEKGL